MKGRGLPDDKVLAIRKDLEAGMSHREIREKYKVAGRTVSKVARAVYLCLRGKPHIKSRAGGRRPGAGPVKTGMTEREMVDKYGLSERCECGRAFEPEADLHWVDPVMSTVVLRCRCGRSTEVRQRYPERL